MFAKHYIKTALAHIVFILLSFFYMGGVKAEDTYQLIIFKAPGGSVIGIDDYSRGMTCGTGAYGKDLEGNYSDDIDCDSSFPKDSMLKFQARPIEGYEFDRFELLNCTESLPTGVVIGNEIRFTLKGSCGLQALFKESTETDLPAVNGQCGSAHNKAYSLPEEFESDTQCSSGTPTNISIPNQTGIITWSCEGSNGGTSQNCNAPIIENYIEVCPELVTDDIDTHLNECSGNKRSFDLSENIHATVDYVRLNVGNYTSKLIFVNEAEQISEEHIKIIEYTSDFGFYRHWASLGNKKVGDWKVQVYLDNKKLNESVFTISDNTTNAQCGTANGKVYPLSEDSYSGTDTFCDAGTFDNPYADKPLFPDTGGTVTWKCYESDGVSHVSCSASRGGSPSDIIKAECNPFNGVTVAEFLNHNYCSSGALSGTPSYEQEDGYISSYGFSCNDIYASGSCTVSSERRIDVCGSANDKQYPASATSFSSDEFCSFVAEVVGIPPSFPQAGETINWSCKDGAITRSCSASRLSDSGSFKDGVCGTANGQVYPPQQTSFGGDTLCSDGTEPKYAFVDFPEQGETSSWICLGENGGSETNCSATREKEKTRPTLRISNNPLLTQCNNQNYGNYCLPVENSHTIQIEFDDPDNEITEIQINWDGIGEPESSIMPNEFSGNTAQASYKFNPSILQNDGTGVDSKDLTLTVTAYAKTTGSSNTVSTKLHVYNYEQYKQGQEELERLRIQKEKALAEEKRKEEEAKNDVNNLVDSCSTQKFSFQNYDNTVRKDDPIQIENGVVKSCRTGGGDNKTFKTACESCSPWNNYEIEVKYNYSAYESGDSCVNYPAIVNSSYTINGTTHKYQPVVVNNYQYKEAYKKYLTLRLKQELASQNDNTHSKCHRDDYREYSIKELEEAIRSHQNFDNVVSTISASTGISAKAVAAGVAEGTAQALSDIASDYVEIPGEVTELIGGALSLIGGLISDPVGASQKVVQGVANTSEFAQQIGAELGDIAINIEDAVSHWSPEERAKYITYISVRIAHEFIPSSKFKWASKLSNLKRPKWIEDALIAVRLKKAQKNVKVYVSYGEGGKIQYVGITNDIKRRGREHYDSKDITITKIKGLENLPRNDAKACEQVLIDYYGLGKKGNGEGQLYFNQINSISKVNPKYPDAIVKGKNLLDSVNFNYDKYK